VQDFLALWNYVLHHNSCSTTFLCFCWRPLASLKKNVNTTVNISNENVKCLNTKTGSNVILPHVSSLAVFKIISQECPLVSRKRYVRSTIALHARVLRFGTKQEACSRYSVNLWRNMLFLCTGHDLIVSMFQVVFVLRHNFWNHFC